LTLIVVGFFAYFILPAVWLSPPNNEAVKLFNYGTEALREGTYYKASKMFEDAVRIDNNFPNAHAGLAEAWMELDYFGRAQNEMLKVNELQRQKQTFFSAFYQTEDLLYTNAINATVIRNFPQAIKIYERIVERNPTEPYVYLDLGRAYEKNEEIDKAIQYYEKAANINSQYGAAFLRLGILLRRKAEYEKSNVVFDKAENIYDRSNNDEGVAEVKFQRGVSLNAQEKLDAARSQFEQVINTPRANKYQQIKAMLQISSVCCSDGNTKCAEENAAKAITLAQQERMENVATTGLIDLGNAFLTLGNYSMAEQNFQQALNFARKDEGLRNEALALLTLASLRLQQKQPDEAQNFVQQALPFFQNGSYIKQVTQAYLILGRVSQMKEDYDAALQAFEYVENSETTSITDKAYAKMVSGNVLMRQEKYSEALRRFEQSYDLYQSSNNSFYAAYCLFYLSNVMFQMGNFEEAKDKLLKARTILSDEHILLPELTTKSQLLNAQIALSEQKFAEAVKEAHPISLSKSPSDAFEADLIIGLAQTASKSKSSEGIQNSIKAFNYAVTTKDSRTINIAKLVLAKAYLNTGNYTVALETALEAKEYFINAGQRESAWRALLIVAQSSQQTGDYENAKNYAAKALETLHKLESDWAQELFNIYLAKPDINLYFKQAEKLAQS
jgi:tetratricopeptide (TPR) repeat protein